MIIGKVVAGVGAWVGYSFATRLRMRENFAGLKTLANTRPEGNLTEIGELTHRLPVMTAEDAQDYSHCLWTANSKDSPGTLDDASSLYKVGDEMLLCETKDCQYSLFSKKELPNDPVASLTKMQKKKKFLTNQFKFWQWMKKSAEATTIDDISSVEGDYHINFRDYFNHEEEWGIMCNKFGAENILLRSIDSVCSIQGDGTCVMRDLGRMFGFFPTEIKWYGKLSGDTINWESTSLRMGRKMFENPAAAEKLRRQPWKILAPPSDDPSKVIVFEREGTGRLTGAKLSLFP